MKKYKVKLMFMYSDIVHVEANSEEEAVDKALDNCHEEYEWFEDAIVEEEL